jgi:hypothetical protein
VAQRHFAFASHVFTQLFLAAVEVTKAVFDPLVYVTEISVAMYGRVLRPLDYHGNTFHLIYRSGDCDDSTYPLSGVIALLMDNIGEGERTRRLEFVNRTIDTMLVCMRGYQRIEYAYRLCRGELWDDPPKREDYARDVKRFGEYVERKMGMSADDHDKRAHIIQNAKVRYQEKLNKTAKLRACKRMQGATETKPPAEKRKKISS